jgi:hypothetical protein
LSPAARAYREDIFYEKIASIIFESPEPVQWLQKNHKLLWYRCAFNPEIKCDYITNNISESFNNRIHDYKDLPICDLADKIRGYIMDLWYRRWNIADKMPEISDVMDITINELSPEQQAQLKDAADQFQ